ncbi:MAG: PAC2 family protein [Planctomycetota bacterium]
MDEQPGERRPAASGEAPRKQTWLVAAWPGMGSVAVTAAAWLQGELGAEHRTDLPADDYFDVEKVEVKDGIARVGSLPRSTFHLWENPGSGPDLLFFTGEAQPGSRGLEFCQRILEVAREYRVSRVFTFAAMATPIQPGGAPRVFAVAHDEALLVDLRTAPVELLREGQIHGLNGVLLAAAAEFGVGGICLLGEMPFFAVAVPNPSASLAVVRVFSDLVGLDLDEGDLLDEAEKADRKLAKIFERLPTMEFDEEDEEGFLPSIDVEPVDGDDEAEEGEPARLSDAARRRIEKLFAEAEQDRQHALVLKAELDRLDVFDQYEDRFLDLFKPGS